MSLETYSPSWNASCSRPESCTECPAFITTKSRYMLQATSQSDPATLIAFLPIHLQGDDQFKCGKLHLGSLYRALAITYTLQNLSPTPFNLRGMILDTCSNSLRIDQDLYNILASGKLCNTKANFDGVINNSTVGGVVTESSEDVMAANRILAPLKIPLVGTVSTSSVFNNKVAYPYLARTISPDTQETQVIADILKHQNWTYVSVVYSKEVYGLNGYKNFKKQAGAAGICIATSIAIQKQGSLDEIKNALSQLTLQDGAHIVVVIALNPRLILDAANELGILKQFLWIGTETWGRWTSILNGLENDLIGSISIAMRNTMVTRFNNFLKSLTYVNRRGVPDDWFEEFYQQIHKCKLSNAVTVYTEYLPCSLSEKVTDEKLEMDKYIIYTTIAAAYCVASGINRAKNSKCPTKTRFEDCFNDNDNREYLFQMLLDTKWSAWADDSGYDLTFNNDRYWDVGYDIFNFVEINGTYIYKKLGSTIGDDSGILSSLTTYKPNTFRSQCPSGQTCSCDGVVSPQQSSPQTQTSKKKEATEPRNYLYYKTEQLANGDIVHKQHYNWPIWAIAVSVPTCVGLFIGIFIFCFFLFSYPVRGGSTVLGFMMIIGIVCIYAINFAFFIRATNLTCGLRRFLMGVVYAIVFAALLVKSIDNWRFNDTEYSVRKYSGLTSACSLFTIAVGIVCVQIIIPVEWLIIVHPTASKVSTNVLHDWSWCDPVDNHDYSLVLSMLFVMFLVLLTAIFSGMAWDSHSNYYESRWICVSCISTAGCFLVWMIVTTNAGPAYRDAAVSLGNFFNATALLIFLPVRKLILLFHFKNQDDKEEIVEDTYAQMGQGTEMYSVVYSNEGFEDEFQPLEIKPDAENGF